MTRWSLTMTLMFICATASAQNLHPNGTFSEGLAGWEVVADGELIHVTDDGFLTPDGAVELAIASFDAPIPEAGLTSCIDTSVAWHSTYYGYSLGAKSLEAVSTYVVVRLSALGIPCADVVPDPWNNSILNSVATAEVVAPSWSLYSRGPFTAPPGARALLIQFGYSGVPPPGPVRFDDIDIHAVPPPPSRTLVVGLTGGGLGSVASSPAGISCGDDCCHEYDLGVTVTLTASAAADSTFAGWGGDCSGPGADTTVMMHAARSCSAEFAPRTRRSFMAADLDGAGGDEVIVDFGASGIWVLAHGQEWRFLHPGDPVNMSAGDLDGDGVADAIFDFGGAGVWCWFNNTEWWPLHPTSPEDFATGDLDASGADELLVDFGASGVWSYVDHSSWSLLHGGDPEGLQVARLDSSPGAELLIDFASDGLWALSHDASWSLFHPDSPEGIAIGDLDGASPGLDEVVLDFGASGTWARLEAGLWALLHPGDPEALLIADLDGDGDGELLADFAASGIWKWSLDVAHWSPVHPYDPELMVAGDLDGNGRADLVVDFGPGLGLYALYNNTTWTALHASSPRPVGSPGRSPESALTTTLATERRPSLLFSGDWARTVATVEAASADAGPDRQVCVDMPTRLDGSSSSIPGCLSGLAYQWKAGRKRVSDEVSWRLPTSAPGATVYRLGVSCAGARCCAETDEVKVTVVPPPIARGGEDVHACTGSAVVLSSADSVDLGCPEGLVSEWYEGPTRMAIGTEYAPPTDVVGTRTYRLLAGCAGIPGCDAVDEVSVRLEPGPVAHAGRDLSTSLYSIATLDGSASRLASCSDGLRYEWQRGAEIVATTTAWSPPTNTEGTTIYTLRVSCIDRPLCVSEDTVRVVISPVSWPFHGSRGR